MVFGRVSGPCKNGMQMSVTLQLPRWWLSSTTEALYELNEDVFLLRCFYCPGKQRLSGASVVVCSSAAQRTFK